MGGKKIGGNKMVKTEQEIIHELINFATETRYLDIPQEVVEFTKILTLKTVAGMLVGSTKPSGRKMTRMIKDLRLSDEVGVIGCGFKTALWESVFLHAFFAHASELEDNRITAWGDSAGGSSWDITVIPLLFSLAEKLRLSGKSLIEALAIGLEVHGRTSLFSAEDLGVIMIPGAAGPAVAAARAMGLGTERTKQALGLATSNIPTSHHNFATDAHYYESAMHSLQGIMAAEMAREDMTGNPDLISYLSNMMGKDKVEPEKIVKNIGKDWIFCETWIKKYPTCFLTHKQIDNLLQLRKEHNLSADQVESIEIEVSPIERLCDRPDPKNEEDLQFSFQHVLGAALVDGDVNLSHVTKESVYDPRIKKIRPKIKMNVHEDWPHYLDAAMATVPSRLTIRTKDGRILQTERRCVIGAPEDPVTVEQIEEYYAKFTKGILSDEQIGKTMKAISHMEELSDIEELMDILVFRHRL
jgi:2-methylcitrate dehydratase PrpD